MTKRILNILRILARHRLDRALPKGALPFWARLLLAPMKLRRARQPLAVSLRLACEDLGPVFIKFGQALSTRRDLLDDAVWGELQKLQDQVPPFPSAEAVRLIRESLGDDWQGVVRLDETPLASASVAQIHSGQVSSGGQVREAVFKVIRPGVAARIRADLEIMRWLAGLLERLVADAWRLHPTELVRDYDSIIMGELNLLQEADNTRRLRENWQGSGKLHVPEVHARFSRRNLLVMERVQGVTATDLPRLQAAGVNLRKLAHLGVEIFFTQVFEDNFFHADMHPGNVLVDVSEPQNPSYIALDCAIIGSLTDADKRYLARNLLAFFRRDYAEVARLHIQSGWVPEDTDEKALTAVLAAACDPFFQKPIKEISFGKLLMSLFQAARQFNMEVQPQLVLLQKTLINIEGMGRQIYPELDLWETAAPFMENWMRRQTSIPQLFEQLAARLPELLAQAPEMPELALEALQELRRLGPDRRRQQETLNRLGDSLARQTQRRRRERLGGGALIAALLALLAPAAGLASPGESLVPGAILGSLGIYWMYVHG